MTKTVLILGASGKLGNHSARAFEAAGWQVRRYARGAESTVAAGRGADVIVNGLNPPNYQNWETAIPRITGEVIAAAEASGATVIIPGNVYHFGDTPGIWSERTPARPVSRKGRIRLEMERAYVEAGVQTIILRAGNFIDPDRNGCMMSLVYLREIEKGRITLPGPAETMQAMCYVPDWARAAVALAEQRASLGQVEDIPFPGHSLSGNDLKAALEPLLERKLRFVRFPWWAMRLAAPVWTLAREMQEMRYLWETDHALCGARLSALLPHFEVTPLGEVMRSVLPPGLAR